MAEPQGAAHSSFPPADPAAGEQAWRPTGEQAPDNGKVVAVAVAIALLAAGWFVLSRWVMHNTIIDAVGEATGVALALLVVVSVIGAVLSRDRGQANAPSDGRG